MRRADCEESRVAAPIMSFMSDANDAQQEETLSTAKTITAQVLESLRRNPACEFDRLVADCSDFTWNQLFNEVDRLGRVGQLCLTPTGNGRYFLRLTQKEESHETAIVTAQPTASVIPISSSLTEPEC